MRHLSGILLLLLAILLLSTLARPVVGSDDSNSGSITPIPSPIPTQYVPSENATNTLTALDNLSQGVNDTTYKSLVDQLKSDVQTGNNTDATQTIRELQQHVSSSQGTGISQSLIDQLKNDFQTGNTADAQRLLQDLQGYSASSQGSGISQSLIDQLKNDAQTGNNADAEQLIQQLQSNVGSQGNGFSPTLKDLTQSLTVGQNGLSVDPSILKSLIGDPNQDGIPTGLTGMNQVQAVGDLSSLSNLMKGIDPSQALSFAQESQQLQDVVSATLGGGTGGTGTIPNPPPININGLTGGGNFVSKLPSVPLGVGGGFQLGSLNPIIIGPVIIGILGLAILIWKRQALARWAKRITPSTPKKLGRLEKPDTGLDLRSPKDLVIYYFRKTIAAMQRRGVPREIFETHREFADKVSPRPEGQPVGHVSTLYEKAMFSGREVTETDADAAKENSLLVEKTTSRVRSDTPSGQTGFP